MTVGEVCVAVGYRSLGSFSATFKRTVGRSPTAWRDQVRGKALLARIPSCFRREWQRPRAVPGFRDPFGNGFRLTQIAAVPAPVPSS